MVNLVRLVTRRIPARLSVWRFAESDPPATLNKFRRWPISQNSTRSPKAVASVSGSILSPQNARPQPLRPGARRNGTDVLARGVFDTVDGLGRQPDACQPVDKSPYCQYPDVTPTGSDVTPGVMEPACCLSVYRVIQWRAAAGDVLILSEINSASDRNNWSPTRVFIERVLGMPPQSQSQDTTATNSEGSLTSKDIWRAFIAYSVVHITKSAELLTVWLFYYCKGAK